jgi:hypothetical protein
VILAAGLLVAGCGGSAQSQTTSTPRVKLKLALPDDASTTFEDRVEISGTVSPADSSVQVAGEAAEVSGGEFAAEVPLEPGGNVIDVSASSPGRRPATDAVRVERDIRVKIPTLVGLELDQAKSELGKLGLKSEEEQGGSWLDRVIPGVSYVCAAEPGEGERVLPNSTVTLLTQRQC